VHRQRGIDENLNAPGMQFAPLAFANACNLPNREAAPGSSAQNRFYCYGVVGRLALLAASIELERTVSALTPAVAEGDGILSPLARGAGEGSGVRVEAAS
jgi:glutamate--cysteine ligase